MSASAAMPSLRVQRATLASRVGLVLGLLAAAALAAGPLWLRDSVLRTLIGFFTLLAPAAMWNLLAGCAGLVSIGQQAYVGLGAYGLLYFADALGLNLFAAVLVAGLVGALVAVPTTALAFRLRGGYFAIGTWVIAEVYRLVVSNVSQLGGGSGLTLRAAAAYDRTARLFATYELALAVGVGAVALGYLLLRRRLGLALTAIRDHEAGAQRLGVNVFRTKFLVYLVAAFGCSLAGAVVYLNLLRVQPEAAFSVNWTAFMIFIVVIGGVGTIEGPIIGTIVFFVLQETLSGYGAWYLVLLGAVAVLVTLPARRGLWGLVATAPAGACSRCSAGSRTSTDPGALMADRFANVQQVTERLAAVDYLATPMIANVVFLADRLEKPILAEGPAGVGKTELAKALAATTGARLIRLQCYEGLDESKALYEWNYKKQLLRIQADRAHDASWADVEADIFSEPFLLTRPLLEAIRATDPVVLLIDEVDRVEVETEALLLEVLSDFQVSIPELGTVAGTQRPLMVLTSNATRELSEALRRRCLYLFIDYPDVERERAIVHARVPEVGEQLAGQIAEMVRAIRRLELKKAPSISETIDWARTLLHLERATLDPATVDDTLHLLLKHERDIQRARAELGRAPR